MESLHGKKTESKLVPLEPSFTNETMFPSERRLLPWSILEKTESCMKTFRECLILTETDWQSIDFKMEI